MGYPVGYPISFRPLTRKICLNVITERCVGKDLCMASFLSGLGLANVEMLVRGCGG